MIGKSGSHSSRRFQAQPRFGGSPHTVLRRSWQAAARRPRARRSRRWMRAQRAGRGAPAAAASLAQVNAAMGARLHDFVFDRAREYEASTILDAYAGSGATAVRLARSGARVTAVEADRDATARCASELPEGSRAIAARVEDVISHVLPVDLFLV